MLTVRPVFAAVLLCCTLLLQTSHADDAPPVFETDIQPLFLRKCGQCHGDRVRKGDLDLSTMTGLRRGGESGEPVFATTVDESLLWIMVEGGDMPPAGQPRLTPSELTLIRNWLSAGARSTTPVNEGNQQLTQHDVQPIVLLRCTACHGGRVQQGGLDLRTPAGMKVGGMNGPALIPGDADSSLMIQRVESQACPPREMLLKFFVKRPPASELQTLRDWIDAGAPEVDMPPDVDSSEPDRVQSQTALSFE